MTTEVLPGRRAQLRDFLRTRRARLNPADVGLPAAGQRRTPGLRREEVAVLAGVGVSWYTWLEQGREINVSAEVLDAIGRALRLSGPERAHLYLLAGLNPPVAEAATGDPGRLRRVLDGWPSPAVLRDRYWNVLAVNEAARDRFGYDGPGHNCLVSFFTDDRYRAAAEEWAAAAPAVVAAFRADAAHFPGDPEFGRVVGELSAVSPEFAELWARHDVGTPVQDVLAVRDDDLVWRFEKTTLVPADRPDAYLVLYSPA
ncbi:helix-turn-helix transcriptional regulator [Amycolatopsis sp. 195334CR]|uniref:helix-turn-helix transcriptional regulator n=1 Tax=Amycolatopsis sp. 195334CR TaxID=2814588 RepID=UPI001A9017C0|nr:helix-turn-helix transcriptional regulator [Amycolatopsis sp. 195334CR]MBN6039647.1 helix-turn-helix domain-containing protein [Amycolatopsis sp. 195334CR]